MSKLTRVISAANEASKVRQMLSEHDDPQLVIDMIEGETDLLEAIASLDADMIDAETMQSGLAAKIEELKGRSDRIKAGVEKAREAVLAAMTKAGLQQVKTPFATFTRKAVPPKPIVTDESLLPGKFWKLPPPTIDKTAVNDAVKAGEDIPGVIMSNGSETIQVRRQ